MYKFCVLGLWAKSVILYVSMYIDKKYKMRFLYFFLPEKIKDNFVSFFYIYLSSIYTYIVLLNLIANWI